MDPTTKSLAAVPFGGIRGGLDDIFMVFLSEFCIIVSYYCELRVEMLCRGRSRGVLICGLQVAGCRRLEEVAGYSFRGLIWVETGHLRCSFMLESIQVWYHTMVNNRNCAPKIIFSDLRSFYVKNHE